MGLVSISTLTNGQTNVNAAEFNGLATPILNEFNGNIENINIKSSAAIAISKLALTGAILNTHVNASAAIAGTKISPDFGSQNIATTGNIDLGGDIDVDGTLEADAITLDGVATNTANGLVTQDSSGIVKGKRCGTLVTTYSANTVYQASADGMVECIMTVTSSGLGRCIGYSGPAANNTPYERGATEPSSGYATPRGSFSFRVNKGDYWKCSITNGGGSQTAIINFTPEGD